MKMNEQLIDILETLSNIPALAGHETEVRRTIRPWVKNHVDEMRVDALGNLITRKRGTDPDNPLRVLVTAHMDEVGMAVVGYTSDGSLRFDTMGGISARLLPGLRVVVGEDKLPGVIGLTAIHRTKRKNFKKSPPIEGLAVDIGASKKEEAEGLAPLGAPIAFATKFRAIGPSVLGKAFDDRAGCAILTTLLQGERFPFELHGVFTVQEEVGLRGALVAAYATDPHVGFALEGTLADDLPKKEEDKDTSPTAELGKGPAITVMDRSYVTPPRLLQHIVQTAEAEEIPYQLKQPGISGTEAGAIHRARGGVPSVTIAVPCRYIHAPVSLTRRSDIEHTAQLVRAVLERLTPELFRL